ncbi:MAG: ABC transporter substrate-binding protein, partial [Chloroflexota bacterium]
MAWPPATRTRRTVLDRLVRSVGGLGAVALAACGPLDAPQAPGGGKPPVNLTFLSWRPIAMDQFEPAWTEYGEQHHVRLEVDKSGDYGQEKLATMFASDSGPDLFDANSQSLPRLYDSGFVLRLDTFLSRDRINLEREWALIGIERWRQKTYGVPYWAEPFAIYYNKSLFAQQGIEDPWERTKNKGDWTLEEMIEAARKLGDPLSNVWGLDWSHTSAYGIGPLIWTRGVSHLQYDPQVEFKLQLPEVIEAHAWAIDWSMRQMLNVAAPVPEAGAARTSIQDG